jgi:hypothetical protein
MTQLGAADHLVNVELLRMAQDRVRGLAKQAFVPGGDMSGGGGDPAAGGGAPPDPMAGGGGGAPPPGGGGGGDLSALQPMIQQAVQQAMMTQGGAAGAGAGGQAGGALKPKIDVNVVLTQVVKILARISDHLGIPIPASELIVGQPDLMGMASATQAGGPLPGMDPTAQLNGQGQQGAGGAGGQAIQPVGGVDPMQGAGVPGGAQKAGSHSNGVAFDLAGFGEIGNLAAAIASVRRSRPGD